MAVHCGIWSIWKHKRMMLSDSCLHPCSGVAIGHDVDVTVVAVDVVPSGQTGQWRLKGLRLRSCIQIIFLVCLRLGVQ